jgi:biopolymer transport protein ExbD
MAMAIEARRDGEPLSEINTTPLIDVMLVLLVMLIITIPPQRQVTSVDSPRASLEVIVPPQPIRIVIDFDGSLSWNGLAVDSTELNGRFEAAAKLQIQPEVQVEPHKLASFGVVAAVMASAQRHGMQKLSVTGGTA